ncbi:MAG TPA: hypothetical protein VIP11_03150 [Gemmatimonadaceae bacterium]
MTAHQRPPIVTRPELLALRRSPGRYEEILIPSLDRVRRWLDQRFGQDAAAIATWWESPDPDGRIALGLHWYDGVPLGELLTALKASFRLGPVEFYAARFWSDDYRRRSAEDFCRWTGLPTLIEPPDHPNADAISPIWGAVPLGKRGWPAAKWWYRVIDGWIPLLKVPRVTPRVLATTITHNDRLVPPSIDRYIPPEELVRLMQSPAVRPCRRQRGL